MNEKTVTIARYQECEPLFDYIDQHHDDFVEELVRICEVPAPPFREQARAQYFASLFKKLGYTPILDEVGNVIIPVNRSGVPHVVLSAHLDTVFPLEKIQVKREGSIIFMVTARFIAEPSIGVNLPKTSEKSGGQASDNNVFLTINEKREVFLNNKVVPEGQLSTQVSALLKEKPNLNLVLRADKNVPHGEVIAILDTVRSAGVTQFGIAVEGQMQ